MVYAIKELDKTLSQLQSEGVPPSDLVESLAHIITKTVPAEPGEADALLDRAQRILAVVQKSRSTSF